MAEALSRIVADSNRGITYQFAINASVNAHIGMPNTTVYGATKAAVLSLTRTLSSELVSRGIR